MFRLSPDEPWRVVRTRLRVTGAVPGAVEGGGRVSGYFTGATGTTIYRGDAFVPEFSNNSFTGDAGGQLVHRKVLRRAPDGVNLEGERPPDEQGLEFAASRDTWVRVVIFANAPDGCLYVLDMYREVIEHPWSIPDEIKKHLDLNSGHDRGRLYRIVPEKGAPRIGAQVDLANASARELVKTLSHANGWHRDTAQRLLVERQDPSASEFLRPRLGEGSSKEKLHVLGALAGLKQLTGVDLRRALADSDAEVRARALQWIRTAASTARKDVDGVPALQKLANDESPAVRFELALTVVQGLERDACSGLSVTLVQLAERDCGHPWIGPATLCAPVELLQRAVLPQLVEKRVRAREEDTYVERLLERCAAGAGEVERGHLLQLVAARGPRLEWVRALGTGFRKGGVSLQKADVSGIFRPWMTSNARVALDASAGVAERIGALRGLAFASEGDALPAMTACLSPGQPQETQVAAVEQALRFGSTSLTEAVLERATGLAPEAKHATVRELLRTAQGPRRVLAAIEAGQLEAGRLGPNEVQSLLQSKDASLAGLARRVLAALIPPSREETLVKFREASLLRGDESKGRLVFMQRCMVCHVAAGQGMAVGPDLVTVKMRGREGLLSAIIDPNKEVAAQYLQYTVQTKDQETVVGIVTEDTPAAMTLRMPGGATRSVERSRIQGSSSSGRSLMPEGLEAGMSVQEMADLLTFIETLP